jgi:hypothetical protein
MGEQMTNQQLLKRKAETLTEAESEEVLDYITTLESTRKQEAASDTFDDELVTFLSDAVENRRARVVNEWDRVRRKADTRALGLAASRRSS